MSKWGMVGVDYCGHCQGALPHCGCNGYGFPAGSDGRDCGYCHATMYGGLCLCDGWGGPQSREDKLNREAAVARALADLKEARARAK